MINGPRGQWGPIRERVFADAFMDFTVNRTLLMAGTLLLRNAIVHECFPWCHGRTCGILANGITTQGFYNGSIDPPLMRLSRGRGRQHTKVPDIFEFERNLSRNNDASLTLLRRVKKWTGKQIPQIPALVTRPSVLRSGEFLSLRRVNVQRQGSRVSEFPGTHVRVNNASVTVSTRARERSNQGVEAP
ncbi:hypothetical protein G5I_14218 [Acromyrmex echinatior]|uniref:Uncharacterized protein n=1 Tax=Acromyrmex echinatior TaxID=103372 RepID=F4X780_ACREC|nr:hypothetical protein G5I_14218 [Acromyrmex echinatior]